MTTHPRVPSSVLTVALLVVHVACGSSSGPTPTPTRVQIGNKSANTIKLGQGESYTATVSYSDGSTKADTVSWESDAPGVLAISTSGRAESVSAGKATITARFPGATPDTLLIQVVPDYEGTWQGDYTVTRCEVSGDFKEVQTELCGKDGFRVGILLPIQITVSQSAAQLTGTFSLGDITGPLTGPVRDGGNFEGTASLTYTVEEEGTLVMAVNPLRLHVEGDRMTGSFNVDTTAAGAAGSWILGGELHSVARTSPTDMPRGREGASFTSWLAVLDALRAQ